MITYRDVDQLRAGLSALYDIATEAEVRSGLSLAIDQCDDMLGRIVSGQELLGAYTRELLARYEQPDVSPTMSPINLEDAARKIAFAGVQS